MTMPIERTLAVIDARRYLWRKLSDAGLSESERLEIKALLRHYPRAKDLHMASRADGKMFGPVFGYDEDDTLSGRRLREAATADRKIPD